MVTLSMNIQRQQLCHNVFNYINLRQSSSNTRLSDAAKDHFSAKHLPEAITENELQFGEYDKIFAAQWLNEDHIICGTKCNSLIVQNILTQKKWNIPLMAGSGEIAWPDKNCGIHSISFNNANTKMATGAMNPNSVGFYHLPTLEPICLGEFHTDWMFSSTWINNDVLVSGSRDKRLAFWSVPDPTNDEDEKNSVHSVIKPIHHFQGTGNQDKVRAMVYNPIWEQLATIASNGYIHIWDVNSCEQIVSTALPFMKENVCIAHEKNNNSLYAVGSLSHVSLLESRNGKSVGTLCSNDQGAGVRSVSFNDCIVTIGSGYGSVMFYDIRMNRLLQRQDGTNCQLSSGRGWLKRDSVYQEYFWEAECYPNAIYAHSYHPVTMKLLTAGGPLALGLYGNYVAFWD